MKNLISYFEPELSFSDNLKISNVATLSQVPGKSIYFQVTGDAKAFIVAEIIHEMEEEFAFGVEAINTLVGRAITVMSEENQDIIINLSSPRSLSQNLQLDQKDCHMYLVDFFQQQFFIKMYLIEEKSLDNTLNFNSVRKEIEQCSQSLNF